MIYDGSKFTMEMGGKPVGWLELLQQLPERGRAQGALVDLADEVEGPLLEAQQLVGFSVGGDALGPVVGEEDVDGRAELGQPEDVEGAQVVARAHGVLVERRLLEAPLLVVVGLVDPRDAGDAQAAEAHDARVAQVQHVGGHPAAVGQGVEGGGGLVVAADEDGGAGGAEEAAVVLPEAAHGLVLVGAGEGVEVGEVAEGLEVAAADDEVRLEAVDLLDLRDGVVHLLDVAVHAP